MANLKENARVCFTVVGPTEVLPERFSTKYESAIAFGRATLAEGEEKRDWLRELGRKYCAGHEEAGEEHISRSWEHVAVGVIRIERLTAKARR